MDAGLHVLNQNSKIQIDSKYKGLCFDREVSGVGTWLLQVDLDKVYVLIPTRDGVGVESFTLNSNTPCYRFYGSCKVLVYSYDQSGGGSYGLQVFNTSNEIVFNSNKVQLKVIDYVYGKLAQRSNDIRDNHDILLTSKSYQTQSIGVVLGQVPVGLIWHKFTLKYSGITFCLNGSVIECRCRTFYTREQSPQNSFNSYPNVDTYSYLVIDVYGVD